MLVHDPINIVKLERKNKKREQILEVESVLMKTCSLNFLRISRLNPFKQKKFERSTIIT